MANGIVLDSRAVAPVENFELWREEIGSVFQVEALDPDFRETFRADLSRFNLGLGLIGRVAASPQSYRRSEALVGQVGVDHVLIQLYEEGSTTVDADGREAIAGAGDVLVLDLSRPLRSQATGMRAVSLVLPRILLGLSPEALDGAHGVVLPGTEALGGFAGDHLRALLRAAPDIVPEAASRLVESSAALLTACLAPALGGSGGAAPLDLSLQRIRRHIELSLGDPGLGPESLCERFALSRSGLYRMFEPVGGVADYIRGRRLERARLAIAAAGGRGGVGHLARALGFPSEAAFSRAYRDRFGMPPREAARLRQEGEDLGPGAAGNSLEAWIRSLSA